MPIKLTAVSRRRPGLTRAEYFRYIEHYHGTVARLERFKIDRYIQNHVLDGAFGILSDTSHHNKIADRDGVVELHFSEFRELLATLEPEGVTQSRANQDGRFFADEPTNIIVMAEETELPVANPRPKFNPGLGEPGVGALKIMHFIMRKPDVFPNDYYALWQQAHDEAMAASPYAQEQFRKIVAYTASLFDEIIFDDLWIFNCRCELCQKAKGDLSWTDYRLKVMKEVGENLVVKNAKSVNPKVRLIFKPRIGTSNTSSRATTSTRSPRRST